MAPTGDQLKQSAGAMLLYAFVLVEIDAPQCADATAPGHHMDQLAALGRPIFAYMMSLPAGERMKLGDTALALEVATAPLRRPDEVLCSNGLAEETASLKHQGDPPTQYADPAQWRPQQAQTRQLMPATLTQLLTPQDGSGAGGN